MSCIFILLTLIVSSILTFIIEQTKLIQFISNISLNIFAGAIILFSTSLVEYFINRRKNLENVMNYILKYRNYFSKIKYLESTKYLTYDEYKNKFKKSDETLEKMIKLNNECDEYNKKQFNDFDDIIESYLSISKINLNDFWAIYNDLRFIFKNHKKKLELHREIFKRIYDEVHLIRELSYHLNIYKTKGANPIVMYEKIREYQKNIFYEKKLSESEELAKKNIQLIKKGLGYSVICKKDCTLLIYNKFIKILDDKYVEIGQMAYFNKKYTGYED